MSARGISKATGQIEIGFVVEFYLQFLGALVTQAGKWLPATVVGAVVLFILREALEINRRRKANARKRKAVRRLISDELERNNWAINKLKECISEIEETLEDPRLSLSIRLGDFGRRWFHLEREGNLHLEAMIWDFHKEVISANLLELAMIDRKMFEDALTASDAIKELEHVLTSMIEHVSDNNRAILEGFADYAKSEVADNEKVLSMFYLKLTGKVMKERRLR